MSSQELGYHSPELRYQPKTRSKSRNFDFFTEKYENPVKNRATTIFSINLKTDRESANFSKKYSHPRGGHKIKMKNSNEGQIRFPPLKPNPVHLGGTSFSAHIF